MITLRDSKLHPYALLAALAAVLAIVLLFFIRAPEPKPAPAEALALAKPEATPAPEPTPALPLEPEPTAADTPPAELPDTAEAEVEASDTGSPPAPHERPRVTEDELFGPLPTREEPEEIAAIPTLAEEIPFNVPPPPRVDPLPPVGTTSSTAAARTTPTAQQNWPTRVLLRRPVRFPVMVNGQNAGGVVVPARTPVNVRQVYPDGRLEIGYHQHIAIVPSATTDFLLRVRAASTPPPRQPQRQQITTFPETSLNPSLSPSSPPAQRNREIPIQ